MAKRRILTKFDHIGLIVICCQFAIAVSQSDCGQLEQCARDSQSNIWCSMFNNVSFSTNGEVIIKTITIGENISRASIDDKDVEIHWNTQEISLTIPRDHQSAQGLDILVNRQGITSPVHVHVEFYNVSLTSRIKHIGETKQIILNCSVAGMYNSSNVVEIRFNDDKTYSCKKTRWPSEPEGSNDKPHVHLLDNDNTCQLTIPNAAETDFVDYHCRVKLQLSSETVQHNCISSETFQRNCYLLSEIITPSEETFISDMDETPTSEKHTLIIAIAVAVPVVIVLIAILIILSVAVVCWHTAHQAAVDVVNPSLQNRGYIPPPPQEREHNVEWHRDVDNGQNDQQNEAPARCQVQISGSSSGRGINPALFNANLHGDTL